jgi:hypothetical protein
MKTPEQTLRLNLPDETLKALRRFGICPEWFATETCQQVVRDMLTDDSLLAGYMHDWAEHEGIETREGIGALLCACATA